MVAAQTMCGLERQALLDVRVVTVCACACPSSQSSHQHAAVTLQVQGVAGEGLPYLQGQPAAAQQGMHGEYMQPTMVPDTGLSYAVQSYSVPGQGQVYMPQYMELAPENGYMVPQGVPAPPGPGAARPPATTAQ